MNFLQECQRAWTENLDKRVTNLPLINSSYYVPLVIFAYLYFVLGCGPRFMKNRKPYSLKTFIKLYDIIQIIANICLIYDLIDAGLFTNSTLTCFEEKDKQFDYSYNYTPMRLTRCAWYYFLLKILDYVETGVFVLRKKYNQVNFLHLYHHISTLLFAWVGVRYFAVAPALIGGILNCFIHVIMYTYYFLAAWGPEVQEAIVPMKKWLTIAQMTQLILLVIYCLQNFLPDCKVVEYWQVTLYIGNLMLNFYMFYNFYQKTYIKAERKTK